MTKVCRKMRLMAIELGARVTRGSLTERPSGRPDPARAVKALYRHDRSEEARRGGTERTHASSFVHAPKCARMLCLTRLLKVSGVPFSERLLGSDRLLWKFGRAAEEHVREILTTTPGIREDCYGKWTCAKDCEKTYSIGHIPPTPETCDRCGKKADRYAEATFYDPEYDIIANPDLIIRENGVYVVWEIKSIKGGKEGHAFDSLTAPQPKHVEQGCHYVRLARKHGLTVHRAPVVLYVNKQYAFKEWYKPFVPSDQQLEQAEAEVEEAYRIAKPFKAYNAQLMAADPDDRDSIPVPARLAECEQDMETNRKTCASWVECTAHG